MWYDLLDNNIYITKLYNKVPNLVDIKINEMNILEEGDKVRIVFDYHHMQIILLKSGYNQSIILLLLRLIYLKYRK